MFFTYVLKSQLNGKHYYGHSKNIELRLKAHNAGKVRSTKSARPWVVVYQESFPSKSEAYKKELFFKTIEGYLFLKEKGII